MTIIAVVNPKGGQAKTTLCSHLAHAALRAGLRVLLADFDSQASLSLSFPATNTFQSSHSLVTSSLFINGAQALPEEISTELHVIRADKISLGKVPSQDEPSARLAANRMRTLAGRHDLCIIDTKGSLDGTTTSAAIYAADFIVCPFELGAYEADALRDLSAHLRRAKTSGVNPRMRVLGLLPTRVNTRSTTELAALADLRKTLGDTILPIMLPVRSAVKQATAKRRPVWHSPNGETHRKAAREWMQACELILHRAGVLK